MLVNLLPKLGVKIKSFLHKKLFFIVIRLFLVKNRTILLSDKINIINYYLLRTVGVIQVCGAFRRKSPLPLLTPKNNHTVGIFSEIGINNMKY